MEINQQPINKKIKTTNTHKENTNIEVALTLQDIIDMQPTRKKKENKIIKRKINEKTNINELWNSDSEKEWNQALEKYWNLVRLENMNIEKKFDTIDNRLILKLGLQGKST